MSFKSSPKLTVTLLPVFTDNYIFVVTSQESSSCVLIDPGEANPVSEFLEANNLHCKYILLTHHHQDHTAGVATLRSQYPGCKVVGNLRDQARLPALDLGVVPGDTLSIPELDLHVDIFDLSGHTSQHIGYYLELEPPMLFCGDALFSLGCGRVFDGTYDQLRDSLARLSHLPDSTKVYCAHEYTKQNAAFALKMLPNNSALHTYHKTLQNDQKPELRTIPTTIGFEKMCNPFLRLQDQELRQSLDLGTHENEREILTKLREAKNQFS